MMQTEPKPRSLILRPHEVRVVLERGEVEVWRVVKPTQSKPRIPPLKMGPWLIDGEQEVDDDDRPLWVGTHPDYPTGDKWFSCPYGGRLWAVDAPLDQVRREREDVLSGIGSGPYYRADMVHEGTGLTWRSPVHMPRWASRLTLEVVSARPARLQEITEEEAGAAGIKCFLPPFPFPVDWPKNEEGKYTPSYALAYANDRSGFARSARDAFARQWDEDNPKYPWKDNWWVWAVSLRRVERESA